MRTKETCLFDRVVRLLGVRAELLSCFIFARRLHNLLPLRCHCSPPRTHALLRLVLLLFPPICLEARDPVRTLACIAVSALTAAAAFLSVS